MNNREISKGLLHAPRKISNCFKDRDEELSFFRDLQKREKDQVASLLQPVSEEFEAKGNYGLYRMESGLQFLADSGKNDHNWLKTPPATPLFPSLEMEANGQELLVMQRELPITHPLSRFAGNPLATKANTNRPTSSNPNPKLPQRHKTPTGRASISSLIDKKTMKIAPVINHKTNHTTNNTFPDKTKPNFTPIAKSTIHKETHPTTFLASNLSKNTERSLMEPNSIAKPKTTRGVSPFGRPKTPGFSDETPSNLRTTTNRPASATRGRPLTNQNNLISNTPRKQESSSNIIRRQSCSPSVTRGRNVDKDGNAGSNGKAQQVLGSRMVDRLMSARISSAEEHKQMKMKPNGLSINENLKTSRCEERRAKITLNETSGYGRLMSKGSLDMALKHMEFQRDPSNSRKQRIVAGRKS